MNQNEHQLPPGRAHLDENGLCYCEGPCCTRPFGCICKDCSCEKIREEE